MDEYYRLLQSLPPALRAPLEKLDIHYAPYVQEIRLRLGQPVLFTMQGRLCPADRKSTRLNSSHTQKSRMPSSA